MKETRVRIPRDIPELLDLLISMRSSAPNFIDKTGRLPFRNLEYRFQQLNGGLAHNRREIGEERFRELQRMSAQIRALFEADPDDKTGETREGCKIIYEMFDLLKEALRKA